MLTMIKKYYLSNLVGDHKLDPIFQSSMWSTFIQNYIQK